jgi:hypothetical protein
MRPIDYIIIHEADTPTGHPFTISDIDQWHVERGFKRTQHPYCIDYHPELKACGYHHVILLDGTQQDGRHPDEIPAACQGHNHDSINICLIGKGKYTPEQWDTLKRLVMGYRFLYPAAEVMGHCQFDTAIAQGKTCPDFDVETWMAGNMAPLDGHVSS